MQNLSYEDASEFINSLCVAMLDKDARYTFVNQVWCTLMHKSENEVIGRRVDELVPDTFALKVYETGTPVIGHPVSVFGEQAFTNYIPRLDKNNTVVGCFIYVILENIASASSVNEQITALLNQVKYYRQELSKERGARYSLDNIVGTSSVILRLKEQILNAAKSTSTVLIYGETGAGKELIAHSIHAMSKRASANFVRVNCSAIPENLMESEFFGYSAGAFTGALKGGKIGRFQLADHGSMFLDEINLLPLTMQPKFLRTLQEHEIDPVGGTKSIPIDVRVIAATNIPLEKLVDSGAFRSDLYYRLNVIRIVAPPLRDRKEDIPLLSAALLERINLQLGTFVQRISPSAMEYLMEYDWPGNVRELQNAIEAAVNVSTGPVLHKSDFNQLTDRLAVKEPFSALSDGDYDLRSAKAALEREIITKALADTRGNRARAAKLLGISRTVLYQKMDAYHIK
jgi:transcriptional regulator with PAS, ATPase and Fis domain